MKINSKEIENLVNLISSQEVTTKEIQKKLKKILEKSGEIKGVTYNDYLDSKSKLTVAKYMSEHKINDSDYPTQIMLDGDDFQAINFIKNSKTKVDCVIITLPNPLNMFIDGKITHRNTSSYTKNMEIWLAYRLKEVREILSKNAVVIVQIKDKEISTVRNVLDTYLNPKNYITTFTYNNKNVSNQQITVNSQMEYAVVYSVNKDTFLANRYPLDVSNDKSYNLSDDFKHKRGKYKRIKIETKGYNYSEEKASPLQFLPLDGYEHFTFYVGGSKEESDKKIWNWTLNCNSILELIENGFIEVAPDNNGVPRLWKKQYQFVDDNDEKLVRKTNYNDNFVEMSKMEIYEKAKKLNIKNPYMYTTPLSKEISAILHKASYKVNSKEFIKYVLNVVTNKDAKILHLSSEVGSVMSAVLEMNFGFDIENPSETESNRQVISVPFNMFNQQLKYIKSKYINYPQNNNKKITLAEFNLAVFKLDYVDTDFDTLNLPEFVEDSFNSSLMLHYNTFKVSEISLDDTFTQFANEKENIIIAKDLFISDSDAKFLQMIIDSNLDNGKNTHIFLSETSFEDVNSDFKSVSDKKLYPNYFLPYEIFS